MAVFLWTAQRRETDAGQDAFHQREWPPIHDPQPLQHADFVTPLSEGRRRAVVWPRGNVILYNSPGIDAAAEDILALGPIDRLMLNHQHEAMFGAPDLDVPAYVHERDKGRTDMPIAGTFSDRQMIGDDLEIIPTPGHTRGSTAFLWNNGDEFLLFPGDTIWVQGGEWKAVVLGESDRGAYLESLSLLMEIEFDVLVPWGVGEGEPSGYMVTPERARANMRSIKQRLEAGENA